MIYLNMAVEKVSIRRSTSFISYPISLSFLLIVNHALANPTGGQVTAGAATIQQKPNSTVINQTTPKAVIDWRTFNISQNESTHFQQPAGGIALNRINPSMGASTIYGHLSATGQIILVNPAGLYFGPSAFVNVGSLIATTANISNQDFLNGHYHFTSDQNHTASVVNKGTIIAREHGLVALLAPNVTNDGLIQANMGNVALASGSAFTINFAGTEFLNFTVDKDTLDPSSRITNTGSIIADGGSVMVTAKVAQHVLDNAINMQGIVQANSVKVKKGEIIFFAEGGTVNVTGKVSAAGKKEHEVGGSVKILGERTIVDDAKIDVTGQNGGGEVLIGGNLRGAGNELNANYSYLGSNAIIDASAFSNGDGGKIILWSEKGTGFYGRVLARGGSNGGNGGFIETSSRAFLDAQGMVDASAQNGVAGNWLLDPANVTIANATTANGTFNGGNPNTFTTTANDAIANVATIVGSLNAGTAVTILTTPNGTQNGDINVNSAINKTAGGNTTLTLTASNAGAINVNQPISSTTGNLAVVLNGANAINLGASISTLSGAFSATTVGITGSILQSAGNISTGTGSRTFVVPTTSSGSIGTAGVPIATTGTGTLTLTAGSGGVFINNTGSFTLASPTLNTNSALSVKSSGTLTLPNVAISTGTGSIDLESLGGTLATVNTLTTTSGNITLLAGSGLLTIANNLTSANGTITLTGVGISESSNIRVNAGVGNIIVNGGTGSISQASGAAFLAGDATGTVGTVNLISNNVTLNTSSQIGGTGIGTGLANSVTLQTFSSGTTIGIAGGTGTYALAANEADNVRSKNVTIGNSTSGLMTVAAWTPVVAFASNGILNLISNSGITHTGALNLTTSNAALVDATNSAIAVNGNITTNNKPISLTGTGITQATNVSVSTSGSANLTYNAGAGALTTNAGALLLSTGIINLIGDSMTLATDSNSQIGGSALNVGSAADTIITASTPGTTIGLGGGVGTLTLTQAELNRIATTSERIGNSNSGLMTIGTLLSNTSGAGVLTLMSGNGVTIQPSGGVTSDNVIIRGAGIFNLNPSGTTSVINNLAVNITSGSLSVTNAANNSLTVTTLSDDLGTVAGIAAADTTTVSLANSGTGNINLNANTISGSGNISVTAGQNVNLNAGNITTAGNVTLAASSGSINEAGAGQISGALLTTSSATGTTLNNANTVTSLNASNTSSGNIALTNTGTLTITGINQAAGNLTINNTGAITQSGAISVLGNSSFNASIFPIDLSTNGGSNNFVGSVALFNVSENPVFINNNRALSFATSSVGQNLVVTANGAISQTGALSVPGTASFNAGANAIDLATNGASNSFTGAVSLNNTVGNVSLTNSIPLIMATSNVSAGTLSLTAGGSITQTGAITELAGGTAVLTLTVPLSNIDLSTALNTLGPITFDGVPANLTNIQDFKLRNVAASAAVPTNIGSLSNLRNLYLQFDNAGMSFPLLTLHSNGNLTALANGDISQVGVITVPGTSTFSAGAHTIILPLSNSFTGAVGLNNSDNKVVQLNNGTTLLDIATSNVGSGPLTLSGLGINQSGAITQSGAGAVSITADNGIINLANSNNHFLGAVTLNNTGNNNVQLTNDTALLLGESHVGTGTMGLIAGGSITEQGPIVQAAAAGTVTLAVTQPASDILLDTQKNDFSGAVVYGGTLSNIRDIGKRNANPGASVTPTNLASLSNLRNVTLIFDNAGVFAPTLVLHNGGNLLVDTSGLGSGTGGDMVELGTVTVPGTTTLIAGPHNISGNQDNVLMGPLFITNSGNTTVNVKNTLPLVMGTSSFGTGTVTLTGAGVSQIGAITAGTGGHVIINGVSNAIAGSINLSHGGNLFAGDVALNSSGATNVSLTNSSDLTLATSTVGSGTLTLTTGGDINENGGITQAGSAGLITLTSTKVGLSNINLNSAANNLSGPITFGSTNNIQDFTLRNINSTPSLPTNLGDLSALRNLTLQFDNGRMNFPTVTLHNNGNLVAISGHEITQSGAITVPGTASFSAGDHPITLPFDTNQFSGAVTLSVSGSNNVAVHNGTELVIGTSTVGRGTLELTGVGVSQSGAITQSAGAGEVFIQGNAGRINLISDNQLTGNITLNNSGGSGVDVKLKNMLPIVLDTSSVGSGKFELTSGGNISEIGPFTQAANGDIITFSFLNANSDLLLASQPNNFNGFLNIGGTLSNLRDVAIRNVGVGGAPVLNLQLLTSLRNLTVILDNAPTITFPDLTLHAGGNLSVDTSGALSGGVGGSIGQSGVLVVPGTSNFNAGAHFIDLPLNNNFSGAVTLTNTGNNNVAINNDVNPLVIATSSIGNGTLTLTGTGISQTGAIIEQAGAGNISIHAGSGVINLSANNNFTGPVLLNNSGANSVALNNVNALNIGTSTIGSGTLQLSANSPISESGIITQTGAGDVTISAGGNTIDLTQANVFLGVVALNNNGANNVALNNNVALTLGALNVGLGTLNITANGAITQNDIIKQAAGAANATFNAGANPITLTLNNQLTGPVSLNNSGSNSISLTNNLALRLATSVVGSGELHLAANGPITQVGTITQSPGALNVTIAAGANPITLTQSNGFTGSVLLTNSGNNNVAITNGTLLTMGTSTVGSGTLNISGIGIAQTGGITQAASGGLVTINGGASSINLLNANNHFTGPVTLTNIGANDVSLTNDTALTLFNSSIGSGALALSAAGTISQTGPLTQSVGAGPITITENTAGSDILLNSATNQLFGTITFVNPSNIRNVSLRNIYSGATLPSNLSALSNLNNLTVIFDNNGMTLPSLTAAGDVNITAAASILQSGALTVTGTPTFTLNSNADILLADAANNFTVTPVITANGNVRDLALRNAAATAAVPTLPTGMRNVTLIFDNKGMTLPSTTLSGNLTATANGAITQSGILNVNAAGATTTLSAGSSNDITLNLANNFNTIAILSGRNVSFTDVGSLNLSASTVSGTLGVTTTGPITQSGPLNVTGLATFATSSISDMNLTNTGNNFSTIAITSGDNINITDAGAIALGASTISGNLTVSAAGNITQSGALLVNGAGKVATFAAGSTNNITLDANNDFSTVAISSGNNVTLKDINALTLSSSTISGDFSVTTAGALTQSGAIIANGIGKTTTLTAGSSGDITLLNPNNDISILTVPNSRNVSLRDSNNLTIGVTSAVQNIDIQVGGTMETTGLLQTAGGNVSLVTTGSGTLTIGAPGVQTSLNQTDPGGNISITAANTGKASFAVFLNGELNTLGGTGGVITIGGGVQQNVPPVVGAGNINVTGGASELDIPATNYLTSPPRFTTTTQDIVITGMQTSIGATDIVNLEFFASSAGVRITEQGGIDINGSLTIQGDNLIINPGVGVELQPPADISKVIKTGGSISINGNAVDTNLLINRNLQTTGAAQTVSLTPFGAGHIELGADITTNVGAITLGGVTQLISNSVLTTTGGGINANNAFIANGHSLTIDAGSGTDLSFANANNDFSRIAFTSAHNVLLVDSDDIDLGASTISGSLNVSANNIFNSGDVSVAGLTTLSAADLIVMDQPGNNFSTITIPNAVDVILKDVNDIDIGAMNVSGNLNVTSNGAITQSGTGLGLNGVGKTATFSAGPLSDITLNNPTNDFTEVTITQGNNVSLTDATALILGNVTIGGNLNVTTSGAITQAGAITLPVSKIATLSSGSTNNIILDNAANSIPNVTITSAQDVTLQNASAINFGASTISGALTVNATGAITQNGALSVTGPASFNASNALINLNQANSFFQTVALANVGANDVNINNNRALNFAASSIGGNLTATATGDITQSAALNVSGAATFNAGTNAIDLSTNGGSNHFVGAVSLNNSDAHNVTLTNNAPLIIGASNLGTGALSLTAHGSITESGAIVQTANSAGVTLTVTLAGADILLDTQPNFFSGPFAYGGVASNIHDLGRRNINSAALLPTDFSALTNLHNFTIIFDNAGMIFPAITLHNSGNLVVSAGGPITQTGPISVSGSTIFDSHGNPITLSQTNNFIGDVSLNNSGINNIVLDNGITPLNISTSVIGSGTLDLSAVGISQDGPITQTGPGAVSIHAHAGVIDLSSGTNQFLGAVALQNTGANDVQLTNGIALLMGESHVGTGKLGLTAGGSITEQGPIVQDALADTVTLSVTQPNSDILLDTQRNDFSGDVEYGGTLSNIRDIGRRNANTSASVTPTNLTSLTNLRNLNIIFDNAGIFAPSLVLHNGGNLSVNTSGVDGGTGGDMVELGGITVPGTTTLIAGAHNISGNQDNVLMGAVFITNSGNTTVNLKNTLPLVMGTSSFGTGSVTLTGAGVAQTGVITAGTGGHVIFNGTSNGIAGSILLNTAANQFGGDVAVNTTAATSVAITNGIDLRMATSTVGSGTFALTTGGDIYENGPITQPANAGQIILTSTKVGLSNINLSSAANNLSGPITFGSLDNIQDVNLRNINSNAIFPSNLGALSSLRSLTLQFDNAGMNFPAVTLHNNGNLVVLAGHEITQSGAITVPGTASFSAGDHPITLPLDSNQFSRAVTLNVTGNNNVVVHNGTELVIGTSTVGSGTLDLTGIGVSQTGAITQAAGAGEVFIHANAGRINLISDNQFTGIIALNNSGVSGVDVKLKNMLPIVLDTTSVGSGNFELTSGGNISEIAPFTQAANGGIITFSFLNPNSDLLLASQPNNFNGFLNIGGTLSNLRDVAIRNVGVGGAPVLNLQLLTNLRNLTAILDNAPAITFPDLTLHAGGNLIVDTSGALSGGVGGSIGQSGVLVVPGTSNFNAGAHFIDLPLSNNFIGAVTLNNTGNNNVVISNDVNPLVIATSSIGSGTLNLTGTGISQTGSIIEESNAAEVHIQGNSGTIDLSNSNNNFSGSVSLNNTGSNPIKLTNSSALDLAASSIDSGTLQISATGTISQSGPLVQASGTGAITITQNLPGADVILDQQNDIRGLITFGGVNFIRNVSLRNENSGASLPVNLSALSNLTNLTVVFDHTGLDLPVLTLSNGGILNINTSGSSIGLGGDITQSGALSVSGASIFNAGNNAINLPNINNNFQNPVTLANQGTHDVSLTNGSFLTIATSSVGNGALSLKGLGISQSGAITQESGAGNVHIDGQVGVINLPDVNNHFTGPVSLNNSGANNIQLTNGIALLMDTSPVGSGTLGLTAGGSITEQGPITQTAGAGTVTLSVTMPNSDILLNTQPNNFSGGVIYGGTLSNIRDIGRRNINPGAAVTPTNLSLLSNLRNLTIIFDNAGIFAPSLVLHDGGNLYVDTSGLGSGTGGNMVELGPITVPGTTTLIAGPHSINGLQDNVLTGSVFLSNSGANNVVLKNTLTLDIGTSTVGSGKLSLIANGITQSGAITEAAGADSVTINGGIGGIILNNAANHFTGTVSLINAGANDVTFTNNSGIEFGLSTIGSGALTITANGPITQSGAIIQPQGFGTASFTSGAANDIVLSNVANVFTAVAIPSAKNVTLQNSTALNMLASTMAGTFDVTTLGALSQSGDITANALITNTTGGLTFTNNNHIASFTATNNTSGNITYNNTSVPLTISTISQLSNGTVAVTNTDELTTSGLISTQGGDVFLNTIAGGTTHRLTINGDIQTNGASITANSENPQNLSDALIVNGTLNTTPGSGGILTLGGGVALNAAPVIGSGNVTLQGGGEDLTLGPAPLTFNSPTTFAVNGNIYVTGSIQTFLGSSLTLIADNNNDGIGGVLVSAPINSDGSITLRGSKITGAVTTDPNAGVEIHSGASLTAVGGISLQGGVGNSDIAIYGPVESTGSGNGIVITATGSGVIQLGAKVSSNDGRIDFNSPVIMNGSQTVDAGDGAINFASSVTGPTDILTLQNNASATGTVTFNGDVNIGGIGTFSQPHSIVFNGSTNTFGNFMSLNHTGGLVLGDGGDTLHFTNGLIYTAGITTIAGNVDSNGNDITLGSIVLAGDSSLDAQTGNITVGGITGPYSFTLLGNTIIENNDINIGGAISFYGNSIFGNLSINAAGGATFGNSLTNTVTLNGPLFVGTSSGPIIFNAIVNGANTLTLNAGPSADILFNSALGDVTPLTGLNIQNVRNLTSLANLFVGTYLQNAGSGITNFADGGLTTSGPASVTANRLIGNLNVKSLTINLRTGNMFGTINGLSGIAAIKAMVVLNAIIPGTIFFDGIDISTILRPTPPRPPNIGYLIAPPNIVFPTNYTRPDESLNGLKFTILDRMLFELLADTPSLTNIKWNDRCYDFSPDISLCSFLEEDQKTFDISLIKFDKPKSHKRKKALAA